MYMAHAVCLGLLSKCRRPTYWRSTPADGRDEGQIITGGD